MTTITEKITIFSEDGNPEHPSTLSISMDSSEPSTPITFWVDDTPIFSMGSDEIDSFSQALQNLDPSL